MGLAITTRYLRATNTRGGRIVAETANGHKITRAGYDYAPERCHAVVAAELARSLGWFGLMVAGGTTSGYAFIQSYSHICGDYRVSDGSND